MSHVQLFLYVSIVQSVYLHLYYSSDDEGCHLSASAACGTSKDNPWNGDLSSEDELEKATAIDAKTLLATFDWMSSPPATAEADGDHMTSHEPSSVDRKSGVESEVGARGQRRRRRSSGAERKKVVKFSLDDGARGEPSEGQLMLSR